MNGLKRPEKKLFREIDGNGVEFWTAAVKQYARYRSGESWVNIGGEFNYIYVSNFWKDEERLHPNYPYRLRFNNKETAIAELEKLYHHINKDFIVQETEEVIVNKKKPQLPN